MAVNEAARAYTHPLYDTLLAAPGVSVLTGSLDELLTWGSLNSLWVFPMATSCCGIEFMAAAASRVDLDRMGTIVRATPRQGDVMLVAGTITVKMAPRVKKLWEQMPEPKWCVAMGSCAISGDFYRDLYPVVPGIDTFLPVDVYVPGCPPNPEAVMHGLLRLQEKIRLVRSGKWTPHTLEAGQDQMKTPAIGRLQDAARDPHLSEQQLRGVFDADHAPDPRAGTARRNLPVLNGGQTTTALLKERFGVNEFPTDRPPVVDVEQHVALATALKRLGYAQLVFIAAAHFPGAAGTGDEGSAFEVTYALRSVGRGSELVSWRVRVPCEQAVPSLASLFAGADWQEREQYDLFGVVFDGHPDLRRILLPGDWLGHPLRRDYPSNTRHAPWR